MRRVHGRCTASFCNSINQGGLGSGDLGGFLATWGECLGFAWRGGTFWRILEGGGLGDFGRFRGLFFFFGGGGGGQFGEIWGGLGGFGVLVGGGGDLGRFGFLGASTQSSCRSESKPRAPHLREPLLVAGVAGPAQSSFGLLDELGGLGDDRLRRLDDVPPAVLVLRCSRYAPRRRYQHLKRAGRVPSSDAGVALITLGTNEQAD